MTSAMVLGHSARVIDFDLSTSVLRLSPPPISHHGGNRKWPESGGMKAFDIGRRQAPTVVTSRTHQVMTAWAGQQATAVQSDKPEAGGGSVHRKSDSHRRRATYHDRLRSIPFGRTVKLVYLKDTSESDLGFVGKPEAAVKTMRQNGERRRVSTAADNSRSSTTSTSGSNDSCDDDDDDDNDDDDDETPNSSTPGTLSPAEALTISRYSSSRGAMTSSYLGSATSGRNTESSGGGDNTRSALDSTVTGDDSSTFRPNTKELQPNSSEYFTPTMTETYGSTASGDDVITISGSSSLRRRHVQTVPDTVDWRHGGAQQQCHRAPPLPAARAVPRVRLPPDNNELLTLDQQNSGVDKDDGSTAAVNTSRTCSNELLNVISIDDDRLRYRFYNNGNSSSSNRMTSMMTKKMSGHRGPVVSVHRRPSTFGRSKTIALTTTTATNGHSGRREGKPQRPCVADGRQRLTSAVDGAIDHHPRNYYHGNQQHHQQPTAQYRGNDDVMMMSEAVGRAVADSMRRRSTLLSEQDRQSSALSGSPSLAATNGHSGGPAFVEMNRALRQAVENVWAEERRRGLTVTLGGVDGLRTSWSRRCREDTAVNNDDANEAYGRRRLGKKNEYNNRSELCSAASDCSIYCKTL